MLQVKNLVDIHDLDLYEPKTINASQENQSLQIGRASSFGGFGGVCASTPP